MPYSLDLSRAKCPMVVYNLNKEMRKLSSGEVLEVVVTDPAAEKDIPAWSRTTGNEIIETIKTENNIKFKIRKK